MTKWAFSFGDGSAQGGASMTHELGFKGAHLAEMTSLGLPIPPGFTLTTGMCRHFFEHDKKLPANLHHQLETAIEDLEEIVTTKFADPKNPLILSVRASSRISMKGMMDAVLNLGLNDETVKGLAKTSGDERFAWDCYARFIQTYADTVMGVDHYHFEDLIQDHKDTANLIMDDQLQADDWRKLCGQFKKKIKAEDGRDFPQNPWDQLTASIEAILLSWESSSAQMYRKMNNMDFDWGTATTVQVMVFGNLGKNSGTGITFSRNPITGARDGYGDYMPNAQGHDVVAGLRKAHAMTKARRAKRDMDALSMQEELPEIFEELDKICIKLEWHYREMQRIEFTVQQGTLWLLQTQDGESSPSAMIKIAVDYVNEGIIDQRRALMRVDPSRLEQLLHSTLDEEAPKDVFANGIAAAPGAVSGAVVFDAEKAEIWSRAGKQVILCTTETSPEDIHGLHAAKGVLTARGGMTSHAAVVARGMGRPCVTGASRLDIDTDSGTMTCGGRVVNEGDIITICGVSGDVMIGEVAVVQAEMAGDFATLMQWADTRRRLKVRTNAESPVELATARGFGAEGIGLCRTEHMFFDNDRIVAMREMILADGAEGRRKALHDLLPMQRSDFEKIFKLMRGTPVTIRLFDPPLHEFLPTQDIDFEQVAESIGKDVETIRRRAIEMHEFNPMLGHRGCRVGITYPEIYEMQAQAIFEAAIAVEVETGETVEPEIMIPLIATLSELKILRDYVDKVALKVFADKGREVKYRVGTMIELPRAALRAREIAEAADFFSFGTNDLTQTCIGISRDDAAHFLDEYVRLDIFKKDPFVTIDQEGVGELVQIGSERGRITNPNLILGICGEHGGDPDSIDFFHRTGLDYVSCSPYRVPIARLAAAQAAIRED